MLFSGPSALSTQTHNLHKCNSKLHIKFYDLSVLEYEELLNDQFNDVPCFCKNCIIDDRASMFPFGTVDNKVLSYYQIFLTLMFLHITKLTMLHSIRNLLLT